jgi:isoleucyl-tRNA synthetase
MVFPLRIKLYKSWVYVASGLQVFHTSNISRKQDSFTASPSTIRDAAKATAKREIESQKAQFRHFSIMADWSPESTYRTLGV